jgi:hypothetical protein
VYWKGCEKLQQANARFNKAKILKPRGYYTGCVTMESRSSNEEECQLITNLYSNRAVTFFREKSLITVLKTAVKNHRVWSLDTINPGFESGVL